MTWPIFNLRHIASASYEGDARLIIWTLAWDNHATLARTPLFQSNIFHPSPDSLSYNEHLFGISLFSLPVYAATRNPVLAYNVVWFLSWVACAMSMHALLRRYVASDLAAFSGSLIFTFSFYRMLQGHGHLQQIWTWPLPLSLLFLERWMDRPSWIRAASWSGALAFGLLGSWYVAVMVALANAVLLAWRLVALAVRAMTSAGRSASPRTADPQMLVATRLVQLLVVTAGLAAVVWPFARHYRTLAPVSLGEVVSLSADWSSYLMPAAQTWPGHAWRALVGRGPGPMFGERTMSLGWTAIALAVVGLVATARMWSRAASWPEPRRENTPARTVPHIPGRSVLPSYALLAVLALLLSFGPPAHGSSWSLYSAASHVPGIAGFRAPARFGLLVLLGVGVFAAAGVDALLARAPRARLAALVVIPLMLSEWFVIGFPGKRPQPFPIPEVYRSPAVASARALVSLPDYRGDPHWFREADYLLYSTAHWRPIVNGYGRWEPPDYPHNISHMRAFPGPNNARTMRALGVDTVVLHASRYPDAAVALLRFAQTDPDYQLVAQAGQDYVFRVR